MRLVKWIDNGEMSFQYFSSYESLLENVTRKITIENSPGARASGYLVPYFFVHCIAYFEYTSRHLITTE